MIFNLYSWLIRTVYSHSYNWHSSNTMLDLNVNCMVLYEITNVRAGTVISAVMM